MKREGKGGDEEGLNELSTHLTSKGRAGKLGGVRWESVP